MPRTALLVTAALATAALTAGAAGVSADGVDYALVEARFAAGDAELELEPRNQKPMICFIIHHDAPDSGDSIATSIHRGTPASPGPKVLDLGDDGWFDSSGEGCEIPASEAVAKQVFADPTAYYLEFEVIENHGTPVQRGPYRGRLVADDPLR